jgi:uncharacterized membrane protein YhiD involved in acid resistance
MYDMELETIPMLLTAWSLWVDACCGLSIATASSPHAAYQSALVDCAESHVRCLSLCAGHLDTASAAAASKVQTNFFFDS